MKSSTTLLSDTHCTATMRCLPFQAAATNFDGIYTTVVAIVVFVCNRKLATHLLHGAIHLLLARLSHIYEYINIHMHIQVPPCHLSLKRYRCLVVIFVVLLVATHMPWQLLLALCKSTSFP